MKIYKIVLCTKKVYNAIKIEKVSQKIYIMCCPKVLLICTLVESAKELLYGWKSKRYN